MQWTNEDKNSLVINKLNVCIPRCLRSLSLPWVINGHGCFLAGGARLRGDFVHTPRMSFERILSWMREEWEEAKLGERCTRRVILTRSRCESAFTYTYLPVYFEKADWLAGWFGCQSSGAQLADEPAKQVGSGFPHQMRSSGCKRSARRSRCTA